MNETITMSEHYKDEREDLSAVNWNAEHKLQQAQSFWHDSTYAYSRGDNAEGDRLRAEYHKLRAEALS